VLATGVSHLLSHDTIYTLKLRRRGIDIDVPDHSAPLSSLSVAQAAEPLGQTLPAGTTLITAAAELAHAPHGQLPVTDSDGTYLGIVTAHTVADTLADGAHDDHNVTTVLEQPTVIGSERTLDDALDVLDTAGAVAVPVVQSRRGSGAELIGWLTHQGVLTALRSGAGAGPAPASASAAHG
jgi:CIC family chloride channel protein